MVLLADSEIGTRNEVFRLFKLGKLHLICSRLGLTKLRMSTDAPLWVEASLLRVHNRYTVDDGFEMTDFKKEASKMLREAYSEKQIRVKLEKKLINLKFN